MKQETVFLDTFEGHLVLICKRHYVGQNNFFDCLRRFWEVRCGVPQGSFDNDTVFECIADSMYEIIKKCTPEKLDYFYQVLHRELVKGFGKPEGMSHIRALVWEYRSVLAMLQIKEKVEGVWHILVSLPEPRKQLLKRICNGNGRFEDYEKLVKKDFRIVDPVVKMPPKIIVRVEGGIVQEVITNVKELDIVMLDADLEGLDLPERIIVFEGKKYYRYAGDVNEYSPERIKNLKE